MFGVLDLGVGNIQSVINAFDFLGVNLERVSKEDQIAKCEGLILPGVGSFGAVIGAIKSLNLEESLLQYIYNSGNVLAICVGLQILCNESEESAGIPGLSIIDGTIRSLKSLGCTGKLPHVGFNQVRGINFLYDELEMRSDDFYFVHSYALAEACNVKGIAKTNYSGVDFISAVKIFNVIGTQFHPEKSGLIGIEILKKFIVCSRKE
jgi:imidazole glycerol phosphate synthase glutamine amidotransferase subunit